jgi:hypothetical protein
MSFAVGTQVSWKFDELHDIVGTVVEVKNLEGALVNMVREPNGTLHAFPDHLNALTQVA